MGFLVPVATLAMLERVPHRNRRANTTAALRRKADPAHTQRIGRLAHHANHPAHARHLHGSVVRLAATTPAPRRACHYQRQPANYEVTIPLE